MGWGYTKDRTGREIGYNVTATCDHHGCKNQIDRGLGYACGGQHGEFDSEEGLYCDKYYCADHRYSHGCPEAPESEEII
jgi:hypothetical protein